MGTKGEGNRQRIIDAADNLFYRRGYNQTSFQDISDATGIPRGNFYYYFKTKDEILNAVVDARISDFSSSLHKIESEVQNPVERLLMFSNVLDEEQESVIQSGCPLGSLSSELAKDEPGLHKKSVEVFVLLRQWLRRQFEASGQSNADELAMELLTRLQGVAVIACAFKDVDYLKRSHQKIIDWINDSTQN